MDETSLDSWVLRVTMASPHTLVPPDASRPAGKYTDADVKALLSELRDKVPLSERRLLDAQLVGSNIHAWFAADSAGLDVCFDLAEMVSMALPLRRPESFTCDKSYKITTKVGYLP